jgi:Na+-transporting methylmalonyl-CoA/oxaloacetate decarboxylase gamma subunit
VNFDPSLEGASNYVALISSNGKTLIDIFYFPDSIRNIDHSYGNVKDGDDREVGVLKYFTPGSTNYVSGEKTKSELVQEKDPYGLGLALIAMSVVFVALFIIFVILKLFGRFSNVKKPKLNKPETITSAESVTEEEDDVTGEELAAISAALHLHFANKHDVESETITIENVSAHYSPWTQKHLLFKRVNRKK